MGGKVVQAKARVWTRSESKLGKPRKRSLGLQQVEQELFLTCALAAHPQGNRSHRENQRRASS